VTTIDDIAQAYAAQLQTLANGPPSGLSRAFRVAVDDIPEYKPSDLKPTPLVSIVPRGHRRTPVGRGLWMTAPELGVLIQFALPDRSESTESARLAADVLERKQLNAFADQIESAVAEIVILDRPPREITQANGAFYFSHLRDKRIYSRFLAITLAGQLAQR
jgi:hypothetical protein